MLWLILTLIVCLGLLILGAWCVSEGGDILGEKYDATVVGGFLIAWLNTAPETIFFITALETNNPTFAVGAISGSVIVVCTVAVGACVYIGANARRSKSISLLPGVRNQAKILGLTLIMNALVLIFGFNASLGWLSILCYGGFIAYTLLNRNGTPSQTSVVSSSSKAATDKQIEAAEAGEANMTAHGDDDDEEDEEDQPVWKGFGYLAAGGILIYFCSEPFINAVVEIGTQMKLNPIVLAFFFAPIASEAPEILESISLARKGKSQNINIAFSNLVGGTISKTTLLLGILSLYGVWRNYAWVNPAYTVSLLLVLVCAGATASFGLQAEHGAHKGIMLAALFCVTGIVQFITSYVTGAPVNVAAH